MDEERVMIFIDGGNLYHSFKALNISADLNFSKLVNELTGKKKLIGTFYYIVPLDIKIDPEKYWKHQKFLESLRKIPKFNVVLCNLKKVKKKEGGFGFVIKGDDIHLVSDLVGNAYEDLYDTVILVSGDEDFVPAIKRVQGLGKKIKNVYFSSSSSITLRKVCNSSLCLNKLIERITDKKNIGPSIVEDHTGESYG
jgi:uncharacterized LabA/DUF88 family protein